jgi:hypothetical protein
MDGVDASGSLISAIPNGQQESAAKLRGRKNQESQYFLDGADCPT